MKKYTKKFKIQVFSHATIFIYVVKVFKSRSLLTNSTQIRWANLPKLSSHLVLFMSVLPKKEAVKLVLIEAVRV